MSKNLLVTLANKEYLPMAKQVFSSAYYNAGWQGDYMLLAHEVPEEELIWFQHKGILIKKCKPLSELKNLSDYSPVVLDKFYLFTPEFKQWNTIVFLDSDMIVKSSLEKLINCKKLSAVQDLYLNKLESQLKKPKDSVILKEKFNLHNAVFNTGLMAFNSSIIKDDTFFELIKLSKRYLKISKYGDQLILNLYFQNKWKKLPIAYNVFMTFHDYKLPYKFKPVATHYFARQSKDSPLFKPLWHPENLYYTEWKRNLDKADNIDLYNKKEFRERNHLNIVIHSLLLKYHLFLKRIDRFSGQTGQFIKKRNRHLYNALVKLKRGKN